MYYLFLLLGVFGLVGVVYFLWRNLQIRDLSARRLAQREDQARPTTANVEDYDLERRKEIPQAKPFVGRHYLLPWIYGLGVLLILKFVVQIPWVFAISFFLIFSLLADQLDTFLVARKRLKIESQLADSLDLVISSLKAGTGLFSALEMALKAAQKPLKPQLEELVGRIRYGDDPQMAFKGLETRVPLETFRLFCMAMYTHWEVGGSLAPTLATVGKTVRDRLEISRRIEAYTAQARFSVVMVLFISWFMVFVAWNNNKAGVLRIVQGETSQYLAAGAILMQAVGIVWSAKLSEMKY